MKSVAVSDLKARLAKYLRRAKAGESIEVRERGVPIAKLVPLRETKRSTGITPPRKDPGALRKLRFSIQARELDVVGLLLADRQRR